ncbi:MAG: methionine ABC transporter permease, partial [Staphylococcus simulans]|nr:methionine ABC transporter permease [Staphylococcus simulans]
MLGSTLDSSQLMEALYQTLLMVSISLVIGSLIGIPLGVLLVVTKKDGIWENVVIYHILNPVINVLRS